LVFGKTETIGKAHATKNPIDSSDNTSELERISAAQLGNERAFEELTLPLRREIHLHCYRMLGNLNDADDALQESLLRAWRQLDRFEPRAPFRAWLYRIATNVCLTLISRRSNRGEILASTLEVASEVRIRQKGEPVQLGPYPDHLLDELGQTDLGPAATLELRESIELAFVAAVQILPPRQRATLLLRDVLGYSAAEVASMLETTVTAVNSTLQRARATVKAERIAARVTRPHTEANSDVEQSLVRRLVDAWHTADIESIVGILREDALLTMPPQPDRYEGRAAIGAFLAKVPAGGRLERFRLIPTRANRQPALAAYVREGDTGPFMAREVFVIAIESGEIATIVRFGGPDLIVRFGLPSIIEG
jgi:RNA polymerase sigma-70 factor (ECF subfamily)